MMWDSVFVASLISALIELVLHYFPWRLALRRDVPRIAAYISGVLGFALPYSLLLLVLEREQFAGNPLFFLGAFWCVVGSAGVAVLLAYLIDWILLGLARGKDMGELYEARKTKFKSGE